MCLLVDIHFIVTKGNGAVHALDAKVFYHDGEHGEVLLMYAGYTCLLHFNT